MYFWLFLNIASDDTKTLFTALISPPESGGGLVVAGVAMV
jgi:hypothetical protein